MQPTHKTPTPPNYPNGMTNNNAHRDPQSQAQQGSNDTNSEPQPLLNSNTRPQMEHSCNPTTNHHSHTHGDRGYHNNGTQQESNSRVHHDISQRFKDKDNKYGGSEEENLSEYLDSYCAVASDYNLSQQQRLQFFHNLFKKEALRFYNSTIKGKVNSFGEACTKLRDHFQSPDVQVRVLNELKTIKFSDFTSKQDTKPKALSALAAHISNRFTQCPPTYRHEFHRVDFLKNALMGEPWAEAILMKVNQETQYQSFYIELANALQFHEELKTQNDSNTSVQPSNSQSQKPLIYFTQPRYARKITGKLFGGFENDRRCWNCDKPGHHHNKCRSRPNSVKIAARKARFYERKGKHRKHRKLIRKAGAIRDDHSIERHARKFQ